jgi:hypothetical protein
MPFRIRKSLPNPVEPVGLVMLLLDVFGRQSANLVRRLGVIGYPEILEAAFARRLGHRLQRLCAVGRVGETMPTPAKPHSCSERSRPPRLRTSDIP